MYELRIAAAIGMTLAGAAALAHTGATGVVMERMMGMSAMRDAMAALAPMMQGAAPYDARTVQENAAQIVTHAGSNMTSLFPEDGDNAASFVKPELWERWEDFDRMAGELRQYAEGLAAAAPNGLEAPAPAATPTSNHMAAMMPEPEPEPPRLSVAQLMGVEPRPEGTLVPTSAATDGTIDWSAMAADDAFEMVSQVCSACHAQFRSGS